MDSYTRATSPDLLTPGELAHNSHMAAVQRHYEHLLQECKDGQKRECYLCHEVEVCCDRCFVRATATIPQHRRNGWQFGLGEDANFDMCPECVKPRDFSRLTSLLNELRDNGEWRAQ